MDTIHWVPPMYARAGEGLEYLYLTTTETVAFPIEIRNVGGTLIKTAQISSTQPLIQVVGSIVIAAQHLGEALKFHGLIIHGPKPFYASVRAIGDDNANACQLSCKGRMALGKVFRIGNLRQVTDKEDVRSNFIGVLATEDNTQVTLSGFLPQTEFSGPTQVDADGKVRATLQKGESVVWGMDVGGIGSDQPPNGFMASLVEASRPVAVSCGSWLGTPVLYMVQEIAADQIVPYERVGKEYILCRGSGPTSLEHPIVIAHENDTKIWLNGDSTPVVLNAGEYIIVLTNKYSADGIMYIRSSKPVFVYQMTGGVLTGIFSLQQSGFAFILPISCGLPHTVGPIYQPFRINTVRFDGNLSIVAQRDSAVNLLINGAPVALQPPVPVPGNPDFVAYRQVNQFSHSNALTIKDLSVESTGAIQVSLVNHYNAAGYSAFYSGFESKSLQVKLSQQGDGICPDTIVATGYYTGLQWFYDGKELQHSGDSMFVAQAPGRYKAIGYLNGCFSTATVTDSIEVVLQAPQFPITLRNVTCFGGADGQIIFGAPNGGIPPYLYSIREAGGFSAETSYTGITAGNYKLIVQDSIGCYNEPVQIHITQPDSFYVDLAALNLPKPFLAGDLADLHATPSYPVITYSWVPERGDDCTDCPNYSLYPEYSTWVRVSVADAQGCRASDSLYLLVDPRIYTPNIIKPGVSDGNGRFSLFTKDPMTIDYLRIFDRWGALVFEGKGIQTNNPNEGWDGQYRGKAVAPGVYVFVASVEIEAGRKLAVKGSFTVLR